MRLDFTPNAWRQFERFTDEEQARVRKVLEQLPPPPPGTALAPRPRTVSVSVVVPGLATLEVRRSSRTALVVSIHSFAGREEP
jgi:hypothetical protein